MVSLMILRVLCRIAPKGPRLIGIYPAIYVLGFRDLSPKSPGAEADITV